MAKKTSDNRPIPKDDPSRILQTTVEDVMHLSMIPYAEHVILERALPRVEDGLKPVQRRILYTMMELGTTPDKPHRKCARIVGDCLGKYHPHGDSSVYDALVRMAQDFSMRGPMGDGHGNFGSIDGDSAAAMRYTEARMTPLALEMLRDIEKDTVPFRLNFDDTLKEPDMLPARFPNLLVNGASGIAVGLATNIPPHNLGESIRAAIAVMENPDIPLDELMKIIPGLDFPHRRRAGEKNEEIRRGYETGRSKLSLRARVHVEDGVSGRKLLCHHGNPLHGQQGRDAGENFEAVGRKEGAAAKHLRHSRRIRPRGNARRYRAEKGRRPGQGPESALQVFGLAGHFRREHGRHRRGQARADGAEDDAGALNPPSEKRHHPPHGVRPEAGESPAHILQGLMIAVDNLDEVIALIRSSKNPKEAKTRLMERFELSDAQAQAILDMRLQRLTNLEIIALRKEYEDILKLIDRLEGILHSEKKLLAVIRKELQEIAEEFADERRTTIEKADESPLEVEEEAAAPEEVIVAFTGAGQLKRMNPALYKKTPLPTRAEDDKEFADFLFMAKTDETLLIFTDHGNCYPLPVASLNEVKPKDRGQLLSGVLAGLEDDEKALWMTCIRMADIGHLPDILFITRQGMVKRTAAADYDVRSKKFAAVNVKDGDRLLTILPAASRDDLLLFTRSGLCIRFSLDSVPVQGRVAAGVRCMQVEDGDEVIWCGQLQDSDQIVLLTDRGYAKRLLSVDFREAEPQRQGREVVLFQQEWQQRQTACGRGAVGEGRSPDSRAAGEIPRDAGGARRGASARQSRIAECRW